MACFVRWAQSSVLTPRSSNVEEIEKTAGALAGAGPTVAGRTADGFDVKSDEMNGFDLSISTGALSRGLLKTGVGIASIGFAITFSTTRLAPRGAVFVVDMGSTRASRRLACSPR